MIQKVRVARSAAGIGGERFRAPERLGKIGDYALDRLGEIGVRGGARGWQFQPWIEQEVAVEEVSDLRGELLVALVREGFCDRVDMVDCWPQVRSCSPGIEADL